MSDQQLQNLIKMINQIGANNTHHGDDTDAAVVVAGHLQKFWAPSMKNMLIEYADRDGAELSPVSKLAIEKMKARETGARIDP